MKWFETLSEKRREDLFAWMRKRDEDAMASQASARALEPRHGEIAVGHAAFDPWIKGEAALEYLRALSSGKNPDEALAQAKKHAHACVVQHNRRRPRDVAWQRWEGTADAGLEDMHRSLLQAIDESMTARSLRSQGYKVLFRGEHVFVFKAEEENPMIYRTVIRGGKWMHAHDLARPPWCGVRMRERSIDQQEDFQATVTACYCSSVPDGGCDFCNGLRDAQAV